MATVNKDFKIKSGLVVEGTTGTINGLDILTKKQADQDYIVGLIGGTATSANTPNTVVKRDANGDFAAGTITADITGQVSDISNHDTDDLGEGTTNKYFTNQRALDATAAAYEAAGTAATEAGAVADDLAPHALLTSGVHGVTGSVVGTTDTQDISNKRIIDTLHFSDGVTVANEGEIQVQAGSHVFNIQANDGDLNLKTVATGASVYVISDSADIVLAADGGSYIGTVAAENEIATKGYADSVAGDVASDLSTHEQATTGVHGVTGNIVGTTDAQTLSNKTLGSDLAAGGYKVSGLADPTANQDSATKAYVDQAIAELVDSAPAALDTLNELAAALGDDVDMVTGLATSIGNKVAKAGDSMTGDLDFGGTHKVTSLGTPTNTADAATKGYVDGEISTLDTAAQGYADDAETAANSYTDGRETAITNAYEAYADQAEADAVSTANGYTNGEITTALTTAQGYADDAQAAAIAHADALDTDDIAEGVAQYFTDARAKDSAVNLLVNSTQENIDISWTLAGGLVIAAENGVADSTTDDLAEGATNKYFSDSLALGAIEDANIQPSSIDITWVRREEATWTDVNTASKVTCHSTGTSEGSMKYLVRVTAQVGGVRHSHVTEVLATVAGDNGVAVVEYGTIYTSAEPLATVTVEWNAGTSAYDLNVTTANNNSEVMVAATLISALD